MSKKGVQKLLEKQKLIEDVENKIMERISENAKYQVVLKDNPVISNVYCDSLLLYRWQDVTTFSFDETILALFETNIPIPDNWITSIDFLDVEEINVTNKYTGEILKTIFKAHKTKSKEVKV